MIAARRFSPLVVGIGDGENFIASDMGAVREWTDQVYVIGDDEMAIITRDNIELTDLQGNPVEREPYTIPWPADAAQKGGHKHFMHKEIHEQPQAMRECLLGRLSTPEKPITLEGLNLTDEEIKGLRKVVFTACGTAYHAGLVAASSWRSWRASLRVRPRLLSCGRAIRSCWTTRSRSSSASPARRGYARGAARAEGEGREGRLRRERG